MILPWIVDRCGVGISGWIARLPQEYFCQATGRSPTEKYEDDGGPTSEEIHPRYWHELAIRMGLRVCGSA